MLLKDRVVLITNVEKFAGHGTTSVALAQGATVLAHDPSFEAPSARRKYETQFQGAHALSATDPVTMVELALKRHGHIDALVNNDAFPALRAPLAEARLEDYRSALDSEVADISHVSRDRSISGGAITAALFLREFAGARRWSTSTSPARPGRTGRSTR